MLNTIRGERTGLASQVSLATLPFVVAVSLMLPAPGIVAADGPDAQFCPTGEVPMGPTCSPVRGTVQEAVDDAAAAGVPGSVFLDTGTFDESVTAKGLSGVTINGDTSTVTGSIAIANSADISVRDLIVAGGLSLDKGSGAYIIENNEADLLIQNSHFNGNPGDGVHVTDHNGAITLVNVSAFGNGQMGATLETSTGSTDPVDVGDSQFKNNAQQGLQIITEGPIILTDVTASKNVGDGALLDNSLGNATVTLNGLTLEHNLADPVGSPGHGVRVFSNDTVTVLDVSASKNGGSGFFVNNYLSNTGSGDVLLSTSSLLQNETERNDFGVVVFSTGDVTLNALSSSHNAVSGGQLFSSSGDILVTSGVFNDNGFFGFTAITSNGTIMLDAVTANDNGESGFIGETSREGNDKDIVITCSTMLGNPVWDIQAVVGSATLFLNSVVFRTLDLDSPPPVISPVAC